MNEYNVSSSNAIKSSHSNGWLMKWNMGDKWLKSPGYVYYYMWDSYSEAIASTIAQDLGINRHIEYKLCILNIDGKRVIGCESKNYRQNNLVELTVQKMIDLKYIKGIKNTKYEGYKRLISEIKDKFNINIQSYLEDTILIDSIIINTDRNPWNMSILIDRNMQGHECPIYDSGNSLGLAGYKSGEFWEETMYSSNIKAEPFDLYFEEQLKYIRNNRVYNGKLDKTFKLLKYIKENFLSSNNTYNIQNTLDEGKFEYIITLIEKRYNSVIKNKAWIS